MVNEAHHTPDLRLEGGRELVKALEDFIVPLLLGSVAGTSALRNVKNKSNSDITQNDYDACSECKGLAREERQLIDSLKQFCLSLGTSTSGFSAHIPPETELGAASVDKKTKCYEENVTKPLISQSDTTGPLSKSKIGRSTRPANKPKLLELALDKAYHSVYNEMPIRLLKFDDDGSNIRLLERHEIWQAISRQMIREFEEDEEINQAFTAENNLESLHEQDQQIFHDMLYRSTQFATLSHTWLQTTPGEVPYSSWLPRTYDNQSAGYAKLANFCRVTAKDYGVTLGWMDTVCINKDSSSELDESIRSMYKWYRRSSPCIVYLADTTLLDDMHTDRWFTRGWTLQEFIAPTHVKFYNANWTKLSSEPSWVDDKESTDIWEQISRATSIVKSELDHGHLEVPISRRMKWAAKRRVTREEDISYSLMGIFNVSISTAYGEGAERAFIRLIKEILVTGGAGVQDIVNWGWGPMVTLEDRSVGPRRVSELIPRGPRAYTWRTDCDVMWLPPYRPVTLTHLGLHVPVLLLPALRIRSGQEEASSSCTFEPLGDYFATASSELRNIDPETGTYEGTSKYEYRILDRAAFGSTIHTSCSELRTMFEVVFLGVLNVVDMEKPVFVRLPPNWLCYAIDLGFTKQPISAAAFDRVEAWRVAASTRPITFSLRYQGASRNPTLIAESDFKRHGMALRTLYI